MLRKSESRKAGKTESLKWLRAELAAERRSRAGEVREYQEMLRTRDERLESANKLLANMTGREDAYQRAIAVIRAVVV